MELSNHQVVVNYHCKQSRIVYFIFEHNFGSFVQADIFLFKVISSMSKVKSALGTYLPFSKLLENHALFVFKITLILTF